MRTLVQVLVLLLVGAGAAQLASDPAASPAPRIPQQQILAAAEPLDAQPAAPARAPRVPAILAGEAAHQVQVTCVVLSPPEPPSVPMQASRLIRVVQGVPPRI